jgi:WXG100 family type VII secretion target
MAHELDINPKEVKNRVTEIRGLAQKYQSMEDQMFADGRELDSNWEGDASEKFAHKMKNEEPNFDELYKVCMDWCNAIDESADDYVKTDAQVSSSVSSRL